MLNKVNCKLCNLLYYTFDLLFRNIILTGVGLYAIIYLSQKKMRISDMGYPKYMTPKYRYGGYIMKKVFCLAIAILLILSISAPAFAAELPAEGAVSVSASPRLRETVVANVRTPLYKNPPEIAVDDPIIAYAKAGSRFNFISMYYVGSISYYYVSVIDIGVPNLVTAKGYIRASDCTFEVG